MALKEKREKGNDAVCWYPWSIYVQGQKIMMIKIQLPYLGRESARIEDVKNAGHQGSAPYIVIWKSCRKFQFYKIAHQHRSVVRGVFCGGVTHDSHREICTDKSNVAPDACFLIRGGEYGDAGETVKFLF